jgi:hypothetical protein
MMVDSVVALSACRPKRVNLGVRRGIPLLHTTIAAAPEQHTVGGEQSGPDRDAALRQSGARFFERDLHHRQAIHAPIFHHAAGELRTYSGW